ncbi:unnamed protein product (macronuclear) [Paramecium tetraurelia]|uniref:Uncharacterized protein n=1 Tax=Paramecium tetraurelia TaxID=5888 RepID=A0D0G7_PARTE|nr:uncharacterized protein GSPATT00012086001 [Paramecium tetraurelia]CAK76534.1 unnamed protein product [Paramecium tetraurelia]|eukprot:XP_001443931.1 hypothetical protein (macronuclear) [Paramecium tetraurelia strain d4-2]
MDNSASTVINRNSEIKFQMREWRDIDYSASNLLNFKKELAKKILRESKKPQPF